MMRLVHIGIVDAKMFACARKVTRTVKRPVVLKSTLFYI